MLMIVTTSARSTCDDTRWPVVVITIPKEPFDQAGFDDHCKKIFRYYERGQSFGWVFDVRNSAVLTAGQRRTIAEQTDALSTRYPQIRCFAAVVVSSAVQRGIVRAITWLTRQPLPTQIFSSVDEAVAWVRKSVASGAEHEHRAAP